LAKRPTYTRPAPEPPSLGPTDGARLLRELVARGTDLAKSGAVSREDLSAWSVAIEQGLSAALGRNHDAISTVLNAGGPGRVLSLNAFGETPSEEEQGGRESKRHRHSGSADRRARRSLGTSRRH